MRPLITSTKNARVKAALGLRERRGRESQGRILIDGAREVERALRSGFELLELYVRQTAQDASIAEICHLASERRVELFPVSDAVFEKLAYGERIEGVVAVARVPRPTLERLPVEARPLYGVLEKVEKPGNVGAVLRSADGAGLSGLILADLRTDLFNPNAIRASLGTIFSVPTAEASSAETLEWLRRRGVRVYAARVDGSIPYTEADFSGPTAIVLGSESEGLTDAWRAEDIAAIRLPMRGIADSLNVSVTAAVLFYEALRQRG